MRGQHGSPPPEAATAGQSRTFRTSDETRSASEGLYSSFQRPDERAVEQDPRAVARRRRETWPEIHARARKDGGGILLAGRAGIRSDRVTGRTRGERGERPWCGTAGTGSR
ncbi:hypothetical protein GCM10010421_21950 [Streptomyces glaucus]|uniref:Uncharacterized protein n=1 Tax=Streptomyces glaucus TaxID=284029 RepID=A0ABN3JK23_9ACTN